MREVSAVMEEAARRGQAYRQMRVNDALSAIADMIGFAEDDHRKKCIQARREGRDDPRPDLPRASSDFWVSKAAKKFGDQEAEAWLSEEDVLGCEETTARPEIDTLLTLPEFQALREGREIEVRWTTKMIALRDALYTLPRLGRAKVVPEVDRAWEGGPELAPHFRLELSLPWWVLATEDERLHALHDLLMYFDAHKADQPRLRKPDVIAHAATLGRFGVLDLRQARAVLHARRNEDVDAQLRSYGFDAQTGQGVMWPTYAGRAH